MTPFPDPDNSLLKVRRSILIAARPEIVWRAFESFEAMALWWGYVGASANAGTGEGQRLHAYAPRPGADVDLSVDFDGAPHHFGGPIRVFEPARLLIYENDWRPNLGWKKPTYIALRLTGAGNQTLVELFHFGFEHTGGDVAATHAGYEAGWKLTQLEALKRVVEAGGA